MNNEHITKYSFDPDNPPPLTPKQKEMIRKLKTLPDSEIDYSDIPPLDTTRMRPARIRHVPVHQE